MDIKKVKMNKLIPAKYNPRKDLQAGDEEYEKIKRSVKEFGLVEPLVINKDMTIIGGHQRYKVLYDLGYDEVDCVMVELSKEKEKLLNLALNKISGEWDKGKLKDIFIELDILEEDISLAGFGVDEVDKMLGRFDDGIEKPEVEFTEELLEHHNYVVLYFDNDVDWLMAETVLDIKRVKALHSKEGFMPVGVGRVLDGAKALQSLKKHFGK